MNTTSAVMNTMSAILNSTSAAMNTTSAAMNNTTDFNGTTGSTFLSPSITSNAPWDSTWQSNITWDPWVANWSDHTVSQFNDTTPEPSQTIDWLVLILIVVGLALFAFVIGSIVYLAMCYDSPDNAVTPGQTNERLTRRQRLQRTVQLSRRGGPFSCWTTKEERTVEEVGNQGFESEYNSIEIVMPSPNKMPHFRRSITMIKLVQFIIDYMHDTSGWMLCFLKHMFEVHSVFEVRQNQLWNEGLCSPTATSTADQPVGPTAE